ncbi:glycosyltransferase [Fulvimarina endophytica]|uniref:Glycosyltransferase n=1 Tax=Fulvimarina endophytica TaxID=2293836 RepID=A0A371X366_9HYPH|nr:glycosyltransferase family 4 protein [Fulvimarina endophytica]RFC63652.1 glycosyltransferase [Fulvimarina endophytica]
MQEERIALISSCVPMIHGGYRFIVDWLEIKLRERGFAVETIYIPSTEEPHSLLSQMAAFQMIELDRYFDRVITFRPPAHMVRHRRKVCWFIHHIRAFYDLWDEHQYHRMPDNAPYRALRDAVRQADTLALGEAHRLFTNSKTVSGRLKAFNGLDSEVLYPPLFEPGLFRRGTFGDEIVSVCRLTAHKRQHLLVEAMRHTRTPVRLRLCGLSSDPIYYARLTDIVREHGLEDKVTIDHRWISEEEKVQFLSESLAAAYAPFDEDSYGYPVLEAAHAARPTLVLSDGGGVAEFVRDGQTGLVADPTPEAIAVAFDRLFVDRRGTEAMGEAAERNVAELGIDWDTVVARLTS